MRALERADAERPDGLGRPKGRSTGCRRVRDKRLTGLIGLAIALLVVAQLPGCTAFRAARAYQRGSEALDRGDPLLAIAELESAAILLPQASEIQNHLGIAYSMDGRETAALSAFRRAVELDCDNQAALRNLADAEALPGRPFPVARPGDTQPSH